MENDFGLDLREIRRVIETAEILLVRFAIVEKRLLVDTRTNAIDGPLIKLVPRVESMDERLEGLKALRPRFAIPDKIMSFWWPRQVGSLNSSGVWGYLTERLLSVGDAKSAENASAVYNELLAEERREIFRAIRGQGYQALWEATV